MAHKTPEQIQAEKDAKAAKKQNALDLRSFIAQVSQGVKKDDLSLSAVLQKLNLQSTPTSTPNPDPGTGANSAGSGTGTTTTGTGTGTDTTTASPADSGTGGGTGTTGGNPADTKTTDAATAGKEKIMNWVYVAGAVIGIGALLYLFFGRSKKS